MSDSKKQKAGKVVYDKIDDKMGIDRILDNIKIGNNSVDDDIKNQDNKYVMVNNIEDSNNRVTITVNLTIIDLTDGVIADILAYFFSFSSSWSNLPPDVTVT